MLIWYFNLGLIPPELHESQRLATSGSFILPLMIFPLAILRDLILNPHVCNSKRMPALLPIPFLLLALFSLLPLVRIQFFCDLVGRDYLPLILD